MKNNTAIHSLLFVVVCIGVLALANGLDSRKCISDWKSKAASYHLLKAKVYFDKNDDEKCVTSIFQAIRAIKKMDRYVISDTRKHLASSIEELLLVTDLLERDNIEKDAFDHAYFNAMLSVAYANLVISQEAYQDGRNTRSLWILKGVLTSLNNSMAYTDKNSDLSRRELELSNQIINMIDRMEQEEEFSENELQEINQQAESLIAGID